MCRYRFYFFGGDLLRPNFEGSGRRAREIVAPSKQSPSLLQQQNSSHSHGDGHAGGLRGFRRRRRRSPRSNASHHHQLFRSSSNTSDRHSTSTSSSCSGGLTERRSAFRLPDQQHFFLFFKETASSQWLLAPRACSPQGPPHFFFRPHYASRGCCFTCSPAVERKEQRGNGGSR